MAVLFLRLCGPMQSWGVQSRFINRDTMTEPSKSGVIGLICAALGKPRDETTPPPPGHPGWPSLAELAALKMGVRVDYPGTVMRDYQTAGGGHPKKDSWYGVPTADGSDRRTVTSERFYLADAVFLVALQGRLEILEQVHRALQHPVWQLYLGRKSFVPACPVWLKDGLRPDFDDLEQALTRYPYLCPVKRDPPHTLRLEIEVDYGRGHIVKPDQPLSFVTARRQHGLRYVLVTQVSREKLPSVGEDICICRY